ncbi:MAG: hypothetical protein DRO23_11445 [Thermoprotei archaeon]|nr:MAG: hypothetical protein DRO23_11445 [Thermoprotei archaeon]
MLSTNTIIEDYSIVGVYLVNPNVLKLHEEHIKEHLEKLKKQIVSDGVLKKPIIVEKNTMIVLDGTHRVTIARELGFKRIPAILVDYSEVEIRSWARIFHGGNVENFVAKLFCKGVQTAEGSHYKRSIVIIINGEKYLTIETGRPILEIYRELYLFEKWMLGRGFLVKIVPDSEVEEHKYSGLAVIPPCIRRDEVVNVVKQGTVFPPKSTRHVLKKEIPDVNIPLHELTK